MSNRLDGGSILPGNGPGLTLTGDALPVKVDALAGSGSAFSVDIGGVTKFDIQRDNSTTILGGAYSERALSTDLCFAAYVAADAVEGRFQALASGKLQWSDGAVAADTNLYRASANTLQTDDSFVVAGSLFWTSGVVDIQRAVGARALEIYDAGDANDKLEIFGNGNMGWGDGTAATDTTLYRSAANVLKTDDQFVAADGITTKTVAGVVSDGSFTATPASGTIAVDTTNSKIYVRVGSTWKSVTVA